MSKMKYTVKLIEENGKRRLFAIDANVYVRYSKYELELHPIGSHFELPCKWSANEKYLSSGSRPLSLYRMSDVDLSKQKIVEHLIEPTSYEAPPIPKGVFISKDKWTILNASLKVNRIPLILGAKGIGKSTVAKAIAQANKADYYYFDMGQAHRPKKFFVGGLIIDSEGKTTHVTSEFYTAFKGNPDNPTIIFMDEITRIPPQASNYLMTILDSQAYIYNEDTGERIHKGKNVHFISAGNNGWEYTGTEMLDSAFADRFTKVTLSFLNSDDEVKLILSQYDVPKGVADNLARVGNQLRAAYHSGTLTVPISHRQILDAAAYITLGMDFEYVVNNVILTNFIMTDEVEAARTILQSL